MSYAPLCGSYQVAVVDRRTRQTIITLPSHATEGDWTRLVNETSSATFTVDLAGGIDGICRAGLADIRCWGHELTIQRLRPDNLFDEVWVGPITNRDLSLRNGKLTLVAKDRSIWWGRRLVIDDHSYNRTTAPDVATVFTELTKDADQYDPSGLLVVPRLTGVKGTIATLGADKWPVQYFLDQMTNISIDWAIVGRLAWVGGQQIDPATQDVIAWDHWDVGREPDIQEDGSAFANNIVMRGANGEVLAIYPNNATPEVDPFYGRHDLEVNDRQLRDSQQALVRAKLIYGIKKMVPLYVLSGADGNGVSLGKNSTLDPASIVPGTLYVLTGLDPLSDQYLASTMRLTSLSVSLTPGEDLMVESSVSPSFQPPGTEATEETPADFVNITSPGESEVS